MTPNDPRSWLQIAVAKPAVVVHAQRKRVEQEPRAYHGIPSAHLPVLEHGGHYTTLFLMLST